MFYNQAPPNDSLCDINFFAKKTCIQTFLFEYSISF